MVLANSNPATIMTDPVMADRTYIEPLDPDVLAAIIERERPDALLPTLGGQTALNLTMALAGRGTLDELGVEVVGANAEAIATAENRERFKSAMEEIGLAVPAAGFAHSLEEALAVGAAIGLPGDGAPELHPRRGRHRDRRRRGPAGPTRRGGARTRRPVTEVLVEQSIAGQKEFELEVMRDHADNCVVICSIENVDPMGVHTGDSITVAPAQTLTDVEYQAMRDASFACIRRVGVETGGSNVQFAVDPVDGRQMIIEMNPRVSRSSALASKATGFPIAKIAARLAVGYRLDEIQNDITGATPACFEPTIDYVVTKIPRWAFEKLPGATDRLGTRMQSVGEVMGIGRTFPESLQKAVRSLEQGRDGLNGDAAEARTEDGADRGAACGGAVTPTPERLFALEAAPARGARRSSTWPRRPASTRGSCRRSRGSPTRGWPRLQVTLGVDRRGPRPPVVADRQAARASPTGSSPIFRGRDDRATRSGRARLAVAGVRPPSRRWTPAGPSSRPAPRTTTRRPRTRTRCAPVASRPRVVILGSGPNRIGQGIEFDYCCVHASLALRDAGYETVMVNCNPETVSTDYDTSDRLYFEPLDRRGPGEHHRGRAGRLGGRRTWSG